MHSTKENSIKRWTKLLLTGLLGLSLAACSTVKEVTPEPGPGARIMTHDIYEKPPPRPNEGSLWPGDTSQNLLFGDTKARNIGDVVTVVLDENFTSSATATTSTSKSSNINLQTGQMLGLPTNFGVTNFLGSGNQFDPNLNATTSRSSDGSGTTTREGTMTGTMAAVIKEALPNDQFVIEGKRTVQYNNEEQQMILTGIIRRVDISFSNTINSSQIADARIALSGEGVVSDEQRVGWLTRILARIWPF